MPGKHAYFSPSAASRWLECPASLYLSENYKEETSSYAHEGTVCHDVAAKCLTGNIDPANFAGQIIEGVSMIPELIDGIRMYIDEIKGLTKEYNIAKGKIEHEVAMSPECWGTADALLWNDDVLLVCDLKMGKGVVVSAEDNSQLKLYSVGALLNIEKLHKVKPTRIINVIIQPRTPDPVRIFEITRKDLSMWFMEKVNPILKEYGKDKRPSDWKCNPGTEQCRWCPVSRTHGCAAEAKKNINDAQKAFSPFTKGAPELPVVAESVSDNGEHKGILSLGELAGLKKCFYHIKSWMENIEHILMTKALAGEQVPGFKLVEGRSIRVWGEDENKIVAFLEGLGAEAYVKKLTSPAQAEKTIGKKTAEKAGITNFILKPKGKPTLVEQADKRPEISLEKEEEVEKAFGDIELKKEEEVEKKPVPPVLVVDTKEDEDDADVGKMSALQRMRFAEMDIEDEPEETLENIIGGEDVVDALSDVVEAATGGDPKVVFTVTHEKKATPPAKNTKRYKILQMGMKGGVTLRMAADTVGCTENMTRMHLKYLNERDGYNYTIFDDDTFKVTEGD